MPTSPARRDTSLPILLLMLTVVTGVVDAVSYLQLGYVFVANMTGNVAFLGFGIAGGADVSPTAALTAIVAFLAGALTGGRLARRYRDRRDRHVAVAASVGLVGMIMAMVLALASGHQTPAERMLLIVVLGATMGIQNATARALAVPDLTTTVLTLTLTGLAADSRWGAGRPSNPVRRLASVGAMFGGALVGALLLQVTDLPDVLGLAVVVQACVAATAYRLSERTELAGTAAG